MRRAYSYVRFSDRRQMAGDSLRRQLKLTENYCERKGLFLDDSLRLQDLGVSGFRGKNADVGRLSIFLEAVKQKRVPAGSVLVVECLDRVSRTDVDEALFLTMGILKAGISIVTLSPEREYTADTAKGSISVILEMVIAFALANEESRKKAERVQEEWRERFTRLDEEKITARVPAWLRLSDDRKTFALVPRAAATVRRIYQMAEDGYGSKAITRKLNAEKVPAIGRGGDWQESYVQKILTTRSILGEFQSFTGKGREKKPFGQPIPNYFPPVVSEAQFHRVQAAIKNRKRKAGPRGEFVTNLFTGLLRDAKDGGPVVVATRTNGKRALVSAKARRGVRGSAYLAFPMAAFEAAILDQLAEVKAQDILPETRAGDAEARVDSWSGRVHELDHKITKTRERIDRDPDIDVYLDLLADLERQRREAMAELDKAKQEAAGGTAEALGEMKSLAKLVADAGPDEREPLRSRLRAKLADVIEEGVVLFGRISLSGSRGRTYRARAACVQLHFRGDPRRYRSYLIAANARTGYWLVKSFAAAGLPPLDLREPADVTRMERLLARLNFE